MTEDFARLYTELGLRPGCKLADLKRAYRRRVAELHPDRSAGPPAHATQGLPLPDLIALYTAATHFHRQHGRLPGGPSSRVAGASFSSQAMPRRVPRPAPPSQSDEPRLPFARTLLVAIILIALVLVLHTSWERLTATAG